MTIPTQSSDLADENILRAFRWRRSLSQQQAADKVNQSRQTWAAWEALTRPITLAQLDRIRIALGLNKSEVFELIDWGKERTGAAA